MKVVPVTCKFPKVVVGQIVSYGEAVEECLAYGILRVIRRDVNKHRDRGNRYAFLGLQQKGMQLLRERRVEQT